MFLNIIQLYSLEYRSSVETLVNQTGHICLSLKFEWSRPVYILALHLEWLLTISLKHILENQYHHSCKDMVQIDHQWYKKMKSVQQCWPSNDQTFFFFTTNQKLLRSSVVIDKVYTNKKHIKNSLVFSRQMRKNGNFSLK